MTMLMLSKLSLLNRRPGYEGYAHGACLRFHPNACETEIKRVFCTSVKKLLQPEMYI
jgi:hypothetical protein